MDAVAKLQDVEIEKILLPTISSFVPLLEARRTHIWKIPKRTFKYGSTDRHQLDIYYPTDPPKSGKTPILFFVYGGGFTTGERILPEPFNLGYANLGSFFAARGFITIIADYRLVPHVTFPGPAEDIRDAIKWVIENPQNMTSNYVKEPDTNTIFVMGHSAGAVHVGTVIFYPGLLSEDLRPRIKGLVFMSGGYHLHPKGIKTDFDDLMETYWGGVEEAKQNLPMALFKKMSEEEIAKLPPIYLVEGEREPRWLVAVGKDFHEELKSHSGVRVEKTIAKGHNHISLSWALGSGQGEDWAETVIAWMQNIPSK